MTPQEKAKELVDKFRTLIGSPMTSSYSDLKIRDEKVKQAALLCVEYIFTSEQTAYWCTEIDPGKVFIEYWWTVKQELLKL